MTVVGRSVQLGEIELVLDGAAAGSGGVVCVVGAAGSGKSSLLAATAAIARERGFEVLAGSPIEGEPGREVWARLLAETDAPASVVTSVTGTPSELGTALRSLVRHSGRRLVMIDDIDRGGPEAVDALRLLAAQLATRSTAVVVSSRSALPTGRVLVLGPLAETELAASLPELSADHAHAVWVASGGMPGIAARATVRLRDLPPGRDPLTHLALRAAPTGGFLEVDDARLRLLETAVERADGTDRARLLARLSRELLGDPHAAARRRALSDEALNLVHDRPDTEALGEVLEARLHALWDPGSVQDRLVAASEIVQLARTSGDARQERNGLFWRFIALMELARVEEAERALISFDRSATESGDEHAAVMALSRYAMLATLRGRFDTALTLSDEVADRARRSALPDAERLVGTVRGRVAMDRGDARTVEQAVDQFYDFARWLPGHFYEATAARLLATVGRPEEATAELERSLPQVLRGSGPRWLGAVTELAEAAVALGHRAAAESLYQVLLPFRGRLVVWGGANAVNGPASLFLGRLATALDRPDDAVAHLRDAEETATRIGALPYSAYVKAALSDALIARAGPGDMQTAAELHTQSAEIAERLGMARLSMDLSRRSSDWTLRRDAGGWILVAGDERARVADMRGVAQIGMLVATPHRDIAALDLAAGGAGLAASTTMPVLDRTAVAAYRGRLAALDAELDAADVAGDSDRAERAAAERQSLLRELRRSSGMGGRVRHTTSESERARVNVTRTVRAAIDAIEAAAPHAGAHLRTSIRTGLACRYDPAPGGPTRWRL